MADDVDRLSDREIAGLQRVLTARSNRVKEVQTTAGLCNDCGHPVAPARQVAMPEAVTCIDCQTRRERRR